MRKIPFQLIINIFLNPSHASGLRIDEWESVLLILRKAQLLARYGLRIKAAGEFQNLPIQVQRHFTNAITLADRQSLQVQFEADFLAKYLNHKSQELLFLKGAGYTLSGCPASLGRVYSDIDILVDRDSLPEVERSLALAGWLSQEITDYDDRYYREWAHEIPPVAHGIRGTVLDIHHNIVPLISGRSINIADLAACKTEVRTGVFVLQPHAMAIHSIIHLFFNEDFSASFRDITDLFLLLSDQPSEFWEKLVDLAKQVNFEKELYYALRYLHLLFDFPLPENISNYMDNQSIKFLRIKDFIFMRALLPDHDLLINPYCSFAHFLVFVRGHWLKMPFLTLCLHLSRKVTRGAIQLVLGEHYFTKLEKLGGNNKTVR